MRVWNQMWAHTKELSWVIFEINIESFKKWAVFDLSTSHESCDMMDVGDEMCWWRFRPVWSPTSTVILHQGRTYSTGLFLTGDEDEQFWGDARVSYSCIWGCPSDPCCQQRLQNCQTWKTSLDLWLLVVKNTWGRSGINLMTVIEFEPTDDDSKRIMTIR